MSLMDETCNRVEALGFACERWNITGPYRLVTGPNNHTTVCYFRHHDKRGLFGCVTDDGRIWLRPRGECLTIEMFEKIYRDNKHNKEAQQ